MYNVASVGFSAQYKLRGSRNLCDNVIGLALPDQIMLSRDDQRVRTDLPELLITDIRLFYHQSNQRTSSEKMKNPGSEKKQSVKSLRARIRAARNQ